MNNLYSQDSLEPADMIHLLLDGELDAVQSESLFSALAQDEELRTLFNNTVMINRSAAIDALSVEPPPPNVSAIFASAGMTSSLPATLPTAAVTTGILGAWKLSMPVIASAAFASLLTVVILRMMSPHYTPSQPSEEKALVAPTVVNPVATTMEATKTSTPSFPTDGNNNGDTNNGSILQQSKRVKKQSTTPAQPVVQHITQYIVMDNDAPAHNPLPAVVDIEPVQQQMNQNVAFRSTPARSATLPTISLPAAYPNPQSTTPIMVQLRALGGLGFANTPGILPESGSSSNNIGIALYTSLDGNNLIGLEIGQEEVMSLREAKAQYKERFATITYAAFAYRFSLGITGEHSSWQPFGQCMLGGSQAGGILKVSTGIEWQLIPSAVALNAGMESTVAQYWYNNSVQASTKTGIFGGLLFHF